MPAPSRILVVDDNPANIDIIATRLGSQGYEILTAADGEEAIAKVREHLPELVLLDVMMPKKDGLQVCRELRADRTLPFIPIILVTAKGDTKDIIAGLESGGDEYLTKPVDTAALLARVRSILRIKHLHDEVQSQARRLEAQASELAEWNRKLEERVAEQVGEIERMSRLKRFLPPQVAELIVSSGDKNVLQSHRREVTIVFCDLRGFTPFAEMSEPEEVMTVLREYHEVLGRLIVHHEGTLERFSGDGLLVVFNDPLPCADHTERAVAMSLRMRDDVAVLTRSWRSRGHSLGFGIGIARGFATLGQIGFEHRFDYAAIGTVTNLASRLCDEALAGQVLASQRVAAAVERIVETTFLGARPLKGFARETSIYELGMYKKPLDDTPVSAQPTSSGSPR
ncbi:MAG: response regulator [Alphaproteobacteria bacterium]|nr:response regulator [Alphaproteobacteria bacterium]